MCQKCDEVRRDLKILRNTLELCKQDAESFAQKFYSHFKETEKARAKAFETVVGWTDEILEKWGEKNVKD